MKKIMMLIAVFLLMVMFSCVHKETLRFDWTQSGPLVGFSGWRLYQSETAGGPGEVVQTILYTGPSTTTYNGLNILPLPNSQSNVYYFSLSSFDISDNESPRSNEVVASIGHEDSGIPTNFTVTIATH